MTSREIIRRNLDFADPERIGFAFGGERLNDFRGAGYGPSSTWTPRRWEENNVEYYDDEWGNVWHRLVGRSVGGEIFEPALKDWALLDHYELPDMANPARYEQAEKVFAQDQEHFRLGSLPGFPFTICRYLRKMEIYFQDLLLHRDKIDELHERVTSLLEQMIARYGETGADGVFFCEDWGIQDRLLISPGQWREIFKPLFARLCGTARDCGLYVLMHSCGYNWDLLDDLADVGIKALQFDQTRLYGHERLAAKLQSRRVTLYSPVDIQQVLPRGNREEIRAEAFNMVRLFGGQHGGFIATTYGDLHGIGVEKEWEDWAYEAFREAAGVG